MSSGKGKEFNLANYTDLELTRIIERKWGEEVTYVAAIEGQTGSTYRKFSCIDLGLEATLTIDSEGWVTVKPNNGGFGDVLGTIN